MLPSMGMRMIQNAALAFIGISAGGVIAAGVFAFLVIIGVFPRLIGKTGTKEHIMLYGVCLETLRICMNSRFRSSVCLLCFWEPLAWPSGSSLGVLSCHSRKH